MLAISIGKAALRTIGWFIAASAIAAPNVAYVASGVFAAPQISGQDIFCLRGQQFSVSILANEALQPVAQHGASAEYDNLPIQSSTYSCALPGGGPHHLDGTARITLVAGAAGEPDKFKLTFLLKFYGLPITISADAILPPGTIASAAIMPFHAPVNLASANAKVTYAGQAASTTLGIAGGTLNATETPPAGLTLLHNFAAADNILQSNGANGLVLGTAGVLYGATVNGGSADDGTVYSPICIAFQDATMAKTHPERQLSGSAGYSMARQPTAAR